MSRRSKETLAVQLFPFLAVLVCTMGSLIFLLLVTTRQIRQRTVAFARYQESLLAAPEVETPVPVPVQPAEEPEERKSIPLPVILPDPPEDDGYELALAERERDIAALKSRWQSRADELARDLEQRKALMDKRKQQIALARQQSVELELAIKDLENDLGLLAGEAAATSLTDDNSERISIEQRIVEMKKRLRAAQADAESESERFQVVPFDPKTGTNRRPIFLECSSAGIRFLPEDITLTAQEMEGFTPRANPLAAGTGALVNYWAAWNQKQRDPRSELEPYILLLVRPDGIYSYYVALRMLEPIRTSHGYELIDESTALKLPEVDTGAKTACQTAINRLLEQRESITRAAISGGTAGSVFGGVGRGGSSLGPDGTVSAAPNTGRRVDGKSFNMEDVTGGESEVGSRSWERIENFQGRPRNKRRGENSASPGEEFPNSLTANGTGGRRATRGPDIPDESSSANGDSAGMRQSPTQSRSNPPGQTIEQGESGQLGGSGSGEPLQRPEKGPDVVTAEGFAQDGPPGEPGQLEANELDRDMPIGKRPRRQPGRSNSGSTEGNDGQSGGEVSETAEGQPPGSGASPTGDPSSSDMLSDSAGSPQRSPQNSRLPGLPLPPGEKPKRTYSDAERALEPEMLAGRRWGISEPGASIGFEREVRVDVSEGTLVLGEKHLVRIEPDEPKQEIFVRFATALDTYSHTWGRPPQGFFWAPRLKFVVKPDGNARYEQINAMMTRAGLSTSHEFAKSAQSVEYGRTPPTPAKPAPKAAAHPRMRGNR